MRTCSERQFASCIAQRNSLQEINGISAYKVNEKSRVGEKFLALFLSNAGSPRTSEPRRGANGKGHVIGSGEKNARSFSRCEMRVLASRSRNKVRLAKIKSCRVVAREVRSNLEKRRGHEVVFRFHLGCELYFFGCCCSHPSPRRTSCSSKPLSETATLPSC